tara:strand:+ start:1498 stop:1608 length:111 start_codon:yes stop_codon:yes gene_type:complete
MFFEKIPLGLKLKIINANPNTKNILYELVNSKLDGA